MSEAGDTGLHLWSRSEDETMGGENDEETGRRGETSGKARRSRESGHCLRIHARMDEW
jgi:hypothetical protein